MTLVLAALCKNGVCVCADKINLRKYDDGRVEETYDRNKVFEFGNGILIYNHGVNEFNNTSWEVYCSDFKKSGKWEKRSLFEMTCEFKKFIEDAIKVQLIDNHKNKRGGSTCAGFVFLGKTPYDTNFKIYELWWNYDSSMDPSPTSLEKMGLVMSGDDKILLKNILSSRSKYIKTRYWKGLDIAQTRNKLEELFLAAFNEPDKKNDHKIVCIQGLED